MRAVAVLFSVAAIAAGCDRAPAPPPPPVVHTTAALVEVDAGAAWQPSRAIPAGTFASGSAPGDEGRDPANEPALVPVTLGAFAIDALPYPNDPAAAPALAASAAEAEQLCASHGARLCTELEWEHACKGPNDDPFAGGAAWDAACERTPSRCASGYGVLAMGFFGEWTAETLRGGKDAGHRCAARAPRKKNLGTSPFRCCHGDRNAAEVAPVTLHAPFRKASIDAAGLAAVFARMPELARVREGVHLLGDDDLGALLGRSAVQPEGITLQTAPVLWNPSPGVEVLVVAGRAKKNAFVVALWPLPDDTYRFASSFLLLGDPAPIALAYEPSRRKELRWTTCWGCAGEQGEVSLHDDGRVVIVQY